MAQNSTSAVACGCKTPHPGSSCPDVTLILGEYQWKVHSNDLSSKSLFFKKALEGQFWEASTKSITLHDDDPWLIVRLIQFVNEDNFQLDHDDYSDEDPPQRFLSDFKEDMRHASTYSEDIEKDLSTRNLDLAFALFRVGDKYMMDGLIDTISCKLELTVDYEEGDDEEFLEKLLDGLSPYDLTRTTFFKDQFVRFVVSDRTLIENPTLQQYCLQNPVLGLEIAKGYARRQSE